MARTVWTCVLVAAVLTASGCNVPAEDSSEPTTGYTEEGEVEGAAEETTGDPQPSPTSTATGTGTPEPADTPTPAAAVVIPPDIAAMSEEELAEYINNIEPAAGGSTSEYCPALERNASAADCAAFTAIANNAALGVAALGAPETMRVGQTYPVRLIVGKEERQEQIETAAGSAGAVTTGELKLAPWVCGTLQAPEFDVSGELRQCKERGASSQISFDWTVSPKVPRELTLSATAESRAGKDGEMLDQVDSAVIRVAVDASGKWRIDNFMSGATESLGGLRNLLLALLAVIGVVGTIIWRVRKIWKNPDADPNAEKGTAEADGVGSDDAGDGGE